MTAPAQKHYGGYRTDNATDLILPQRLATMSHQTGKITGSR
jgi:hypothetical protein